MNKLFNQVPNLIIIKVPFLSRRNILSYLVTYMMHLSLSHVCTMVLISGHNLYIPSKEARAFRIFFHLATTITHFFSILQIRNNALMYLFLPFREHICPKYKRIHRYLRHLDTKSSILHGCG